MKKIIFPFILFSITINSQTPNPFYLPENIRKFADHLFTEKDYLRSVFEYEKLLQYGKNDTIEFKIPVAYQLMGKYDLALQGFSEINKESVYYDESEKEYCKTLLLSARYDELQNKLTRNDVKDYQRLLYLSYLFTSAKLPGEQNFLNAFPSSEKENLQDFFNEKRDPPYKSSLLAGLFSTIIPGSGKIYLGEIGDGVTAFIATSLFAFLSYDNFRANHNFRGWIFSGIGVFFYTGNIYGSVAAAQIYNAKVDYEYKKKLKDYLNDKNYFMERNDFDK
jgi:TM2 domain-containing membrane protein YozV